MSKYQIPKTYPEIGHGAIPEFTLNLKGNVFLYIAKAHTHTKAISEFALNLKVMFSCTLPKHTHTKFSCQR